MPDPRDRFASHPLTFRTSIYVPSLAAGGEWFLDTIHPTPRHHLQPSASNLGIPCSFVHTQHSTASRGSSISLAHRPLCNRSLSPVTTWISLTYPPYLCIFRLYIRLATLIPRSSSPFPHWPLHLLLIQISIRSCIRITAIVLFRAHSFHLSLGLRHFRVEYTPPDRKSVV